MVLGPLADGSFIVCPVGFALFEINSHKFGFQLHRFQLVLLFNRFERSVHGHQRNRDDSLSGGADIGFSVEFLLGSFFFERLKSSCFDSCTFQPRLLHQVSLFPLFLEPFFFDPFGLAETQNFFSLEPLLLHADELLFFNIIKFSS